MRPDAEFRVRLLPPSTPSLAIGVPPSPPGTLYVLAARGGLAATPRRGFAVLFGRNEPDVHVCVGGDDQQVSRCHGRLLCDGESWSLRNEGRLPIRLPDSRLLLFGEETVLADGYSPLVIRSSARREHTLEVRVVGAPARDPAEGAAPNDTTLHRLAHELSDEERLVLTSLAQRYLREDPYPQPQSWKQVAEELNELAGEQRWNPHLAANVVGKVRDRLFRAGVKGLTREEVGEPVGNTLNHNLIRELLETTTLVPANLGLLGDDN